MTLQDQHQPQKQQQQQQEMMEEKQEDEREDEKLQSPLRLKNGWQEALAQHLETGNIFIPRLIEDCFDLHEQQQPIGKVCILSIDGGGMRGIIPAKILSMLELILQRKTNDPQVRIADFFDVAAGTNVGGILTTMLFTGDDEEKANGRPLFRAEDTLKFILDNGKQIFGRKKKKKKKKWGCLGGSKSPNKSGEDELRKILAAKKTKKELTLRDTIKPILIPCYDLSSACPFLFSRAGAIDSEAWDFKLWEICCATTADPSPLFGPARITSVDGKTVCTAVDGSMAMNNPSAAAITHVLHNRMEFPGVRSVRDLMVLSLGTGQFDQAHSYASARNWNQAQWSKATARIVLDNVSDSVDHTVAMAFGEARSNYLRIQASGADAAAEMDDWREANVARMITAAEEVMEQKAVEYVPFGGKRMLDESNYERLEWFADQLIEEHRARALRSSPTVILKTL